MVTEAYLYLSTTFWKWALGLLAVDGALAAVDRFLVHVNFPRKLYIWLAFLMIFFAGFQAWREEHGIRVRNEQALSEASTRIARLEAESRIGGPIGLDLSEARHFQPDGIISSGDPLQSGVTGESAASRPLRKFTVARDAQDSDAALRALEEIDAVAPSFIYADYYRALYLERLSRPNEAQRARRRLAERANQILAVAPRHPYALFVKAYCLLKDQEVTESERMLQGIPEQEIEAVMGDFLSFAGPDAPVPPMWQRFLEAFMRAHKVKLTK